MPRNYIHIKLYEKDDCRTEKAEKQIKKYLKNSVFQVKQVKNLLYSNKVNRERQTIRKIRCNRTG